MIDSGWTTYRSQHLCAKHPPSSPNWIAGARAFLARAEPVYRSMGLVTISSEVVRLEMMKTSADADPEVARSDSQDADEALRELTSGVAGVLDARVADAERALAEAIAHLLDALRGKP